MDISSFHASYQALLHCSHLAQGACLLMCECSLVCFFYVILPLADIYVCTQQLTRTYFSWVVFVQASQFLRIITFYSTQLPGPNYHCREVWWLVEASSSCGVILPTPTCLGKKKAMLLLLLSSSSSVTMRYDYDLGIFH